MGGKGRREPEGRKRRSREDEDMKVYRRRRRKWNNGRNWRMEGKGGEGSCSAVNYCYGSEIMGRRGGPER